MKDSNLGRLIMRWEWRLAAVGCVVGLLVAGCGGGGSGTAVGAQGRGVAEPGAGDLPLRVGATWSYAISNVAGMKGQGSTTVEAAENAPASGQPALRVRTTLLDGGTLSWEALSDPGVVRFEAQQLDSNGAVVADKQYAPPIIVLDESSPHLTSGAAWTESYQETKVPSKKGKATKETVQWTVEAVGEMVTVPAGTFSCIRVRRNHTSSKSPSNEVAWYAQGVGKVRGTGAGPFNDQTVELSSFSLP
jgi:hypothetical protein